MNLPAAADDAGSRLERLCAWPAAHDQLVDLALAALLWLLTAAAYHVSYAGPPKCALEMLALFGVATRQAVPLARRRTRPGPSWAVVVLGHVAQLLVEGRDRGAGRGARCRLIRGPGLGLRRGQPHHLRPRPAPAKGVSRRRVVGDAS
ncbi:hypothetical protein ON003_01455 [Janibacter hoylei]|uniref:DUF7134 domain-containing protein n=1 Tax=Janibacter hoylei TaxID=364298 RepID=UPI00223878D7|nr:hypothetical protein [Janibacter hoylei]MCW4600419.1 hypothetical protein [Janibacter hoylei]